MRPFRSRSYAVALGVVLSTSAAAAALSLAAMERGPTPRTGSDTKRASSYEQGAAAARAGDCRTALPLLERALAATPKDADVLNLLAYCQRKSGRLDEAFANYRRALEIRPRFPAAREYLGEAHIQATLREIETLRSYGDSARDELADLLAALRKAAEEAARDEGSAPAPARRGGW